MAKKTICKNCKFSYMETDDQGGKQLLCRRYPPTWQLTPMPPKPASSLAVIGTQQPQRQMQIAKRTDFPGIPEDQWCGEWVGKAK